MPIRPPFIRNLRELESSTDSYPNDDEALSEGTPLSRPLGLTRLGIHHERLAPGVRTSWPHSHSTSEEFVYVLEGTPDVWIDGELHRLAVGDAIAFVPGTGISHTFINNSEHDARLLVVGERPSDDKGHYPFHPNGFHGMPTNRIWTDVPVRARGGHDGLPDLRRNKPKL